MFFGKCKSQIVWNDYWQDLNPRLSASLTKRHPRSINGVPQARWFMMENPSING